MLEALEMKNWCQSVLDLRPKSQQTLRQGLTDKFKAKKFDYWCTLVAELDVCVEPVLTIDEAVQHPHLKHRQVLVEVASEGDQTITQLASPIRFSATPTRYQRAGGKLGCDTQNVLTELEFTRETIDSFATQQVIPPLKAKSTMGISHESAFRLYPASPP